MSRWSAYTREEKRLSTFLHALGVALLFSGIALVFAPSLFPASSFFLSPPFWVSNTIAGLLLLAFLAWFSAADVRRFRAMLYVLIGGLLVGAAAMLAMVLSAGTSPSLLIGFGLFAVAGLATAALLSHAKLPQAPWLPWIPDKPFSSWERFARVFFGVFGIVSLGAAVLSILLPSLVPDSPFVANPFMLAGSSVKLAVLGLCALPLAYDVRRYTHHTQMITALIIGNMASLIAIMLLALFGYERFGGFSLSVGGLTLSREQFMFGAWALDVVVVTALAFLNHQINRGLLDYLGFLTPAQFRALEAIAETLVAGDSDAAEIVPPHQIVLRTDSYLKSFASNRLGLARLAAMGLQSMPIIWGHPPINYMNPAARETFIDQRFKKELINPNPLYVTLDNVVRAVNQLLLRIQGRPQEDVGAALSFTGLLDAMMRFNMQLTYLGYYSNPDVWPKQPDGSGIGYVPFSKREKDFPVIPRRPYPAVDVMTPEVLERKGIDVISDADVVIIGSGAAGAILAEQLLEQGRRVVMLEKGRYVHPDNFSEDEIDMISRLYSDGALQISQALRFTILQGSCLGGTTVVNNAVCFDTPRRVLDHWNGRGATPVLDVEKFYASQQAVRRRLHIQPIKAGTRKPLDGGVLNHGDGVVTAAIHKYFEGTGVAYKADVIEANIVDCLGCGYCNIGCQYGRKLSMLDEVLPAAQQKYGAENFRIFSEAEVVKLEHDGGNVRRITARVNGKRTLTIDHPKTVIVSAGTIASSWLLMQSGIGKGKLPVGKGLSFNMGSPLHALFDRELNSYDGLQISHYLAIEDHPGFVYETWYNPPVAQALAMPGWLDTHFRNMQNYNRMAAVGVLVGTEANAYLVPALVTGGPDVVFQPTKDDLKKLVDALVILGDIFFTGGALEVYASTRSYQSYRNHAAIFSAQSEIDRLRELVQHDYDILLGTGHPQGGNAIGASPENGVIGPDFKVFGYDNLYVCDASVFPTSTTVNPQLTVMTMAHYASQCID